jgi:hypothetical protein
MPALEQFQRENPQHTLYGSEFWDPRIPPSSIIDPAFDPKRPSMFEQFLGCRPSSVFIEWQTGRQPEMPPRYRVSAPSSALVFACVKKVLPQGYTIEKAA